MQKASLNIHKMLTLIALLELLSFALAIEPIVVIEDGVLKGSISTDMNGKDFFSFQKIPFAAPPIGSLRFKDPQPVQNWTGIRDATKEGPVCLQKQFLLHGEITGAEDCLFLNVYTPELSPRKLKSVLVFIHGGGFAEGSGIQSFFGPQFLVSEDIVLVTLNYRLGLFGFMNFNNPKLGIPGNAALKDQVAALKWIQTNIHHFGGDRNKVTISGQSAGAASVHLHTISPYSKGLFHRAILQSGSALGSWCNGERNNGVTTAKFLGFQGDDEVAMVKFLQNATADELSTASNGTIFIEIDHPARFGPSVETKTRNAFLTDLPRNLVKKGMYNREIELMIGLTSTEGMIIDAFTIVRDGSYTPWPIEKLIPYYFELTPTKKQELIQKINNFYNFDNTSNPDGHLFLQSDSYLTFPIFETVFAHLRYNQVVYFYLVSSDSRMNFWKYSNDITSTYNGVAHVDDLYYLYTHTDTPYVAYIPGTIENKAIKNNIRLFANYVKYGKPTLLLWDFTKWKPATKQSLYYLDINLDENTLGVEFYKERISFWCDLYRENNVLHFCPPSWTNL